MTLDQIEAAVRKHQLTIFGTVQDETPDGVKTLILLGPLEPGFWEMFTASPEYLDKGVNPLDRWSFRIITSLAETLVAKAFFPFGGPPHQPFIGWSKKSGRAHESPVGLLVHDTAGLMVSYRGALGFAQRFDIPVPPGNPCETCADQPCRTACPVDAFGPDGYDVPKCKTDLDRDGNDCMSRGCAVRRACPISQSYGRVEAQSAFHMRSFR